MRDSKDSVKFMQVLDRAIFQKLKEVARARGVTVQELIRVLIIPDWMRRSDEETRKVEILRRQKRARIRQRIKGPSLIKVRTPPKRH